MTPVRLKPAAPLESSILPLGHCVTGPGTAVRNFSGNRCKSDCRSRGCKFDSSLVPYSPVENQNNLELDFKVFFFADSCCSDIVVDESN